MRYLLFISLSACTPSQIDGNQVGAMPNPRPTESHEVTDVHLVPAQATGDLLLVLDGSWTMVEERAKVAQAVPALLNALGPWRVDWRVGVISSDMSDPAAAGHLQQFEGRFNGERWLDSETYDAEGALSTMIADVPVRASEQRGLDAASAALEDVSGFNAGFRRAYATLDLLFISDEDDHSVASVPEWTNWFDGLDAPPNGRHVHAWVGGDPICPSAEAPGAVYTELAHIFDGHHAPICSGDFEDAATAIGHVVSGRLRAFPLSSIPAADTLTVHAYDPFGTMLFGFDERDWHFDPVTNAVLFEYYLPEPGTEVHLTYRMLEPAP